MVRDVYSCVLRQLSQGLEEVQRDTLALRSFLLQIWDQGAQRKEEYMCIVVHGVHARKAGAKKETDQVILALSQ